MAEDVVPDREKPLAGVVLCCTSILPEERVQLVATAAQMGAIHTFDLTSDVTHLIVGETNTPKYKYVAKERSDVKVVRAEWVEAVRSSWMLGGDTNLHALEEVYRLPTFAGLAICLTGFDDLDYRNYLQQQITSHGGDFRRDLTKSVTHLVARSGHGQKYKFAILWNIKVVSLRWLEDSMDRGMILEESLYDPLLPAAEQGINAWNPVAPVQVEKRIKNKEAKSQRPRKLRRVTSVKLGDQNEGIWTDIVGQSTGLSRNETPDDPFAMSPKATSRSLPQETKSFASETTLAERRDSKAQETFGSALKAAEKPRGIWYQSKFFISGFTEKQTKILEGHLVSRDAEVALSINDLTKGSAESFRLYMLVPYTLPQLDIPSTANSDDGIDIVTDMWIEKCLYSNSFVPPEANITSTPIFKFPLPAFQDLRICSTGFAGIELLHLSKLVKLLGATYDEYFTSKASVLICNTANPNKEKLRHANQWNIPAVLADWLWISVQTGDKKHFGPYLISPLQPAIHKGEKVSRVTNHSPDVPKEPEQDLGNSNTQQRQETQSKDEDNSLIDDALPNSIDLAPGFCASPIKENISAPLTLPPPAADNNEEKPSTSSNSLDQAISDLLKKNRSRSKPIGATEKGPSNAGPQRRRKLFGRANSNASMLGTKEPTKFGLSRASSIDTLNEDGYGSVVDGLTSPSVRGPSKAPSLASFPAPAALLTEKSDHTEAQQLLERRLNLLRNQSTNEFAAEEFEFGDEATPPMTQLGYEDPDAIAMREKIAGSVRNIKVAEKSDVEENNRDKKKSGVNLVVEPLQDNEKLAGWGGGRRTRSKRASAGKEL